MEKKLAPHISQLLYEHDCVIVPGFGGFVANYQSAAIHPTQHTFSPPSKKIAFNRNLQNNDGLLANRIVLSEKISYPEANQNILSEVETWNKSLETNKKLSIEKVGTLLFDVEKNLRFEPDTKVNYLLDSFGLVEVQSPPIKRENFREQLKPKAKDWETAKPLPERFWLSTHKWKVAASVLILFGAAELGWLSYKSGVLTHNTINFAYLNPFSDSSWFGKRAADAAKANSVPAPQPKQDVPLVSTDSATPADANKTIQDTLKTEVSGTETVSPENSKTEPIASEKVAVKPEIKPAQPNPEMPPAQTEDGSSRKYSVVAGCFSIPENADRLLASLKSKGYHAAIAGKTAKGLTMVIYDSFDSRRDALPFLHKVKAEEDSTAWLFRN